jgi:hypothetical protein
MNLSNPTSYLHPRTLSAMSRAMLSVPNVRLPIDNPPEGYWQDCDKGNDASLVKRTVLFFTALYPLHSNLSFNGQLKCNNRCILLFLQVVSKRQSSSPTRPLTAMESTGGYIPRCMSSSRLQWRA